jgi:predicted transcriptional regulator
MGTAPSAQGIRHSILDLAPLELDCLSALWPLGEATVREIQKALAPTKPRAYTTIMTILDRLAHKGVVQRRKLGRAWTYRSNMSEQEARSRAVAQLVQSFFDGSAEALTAHIVSNALTARVTSDTLATNASDAPSESGAVGAGGAPAAEKRPAAVSPRKQREVDVTATEREEVKSTALETTLL